MNFLMDFDTIYFDRFVRQHENLICYLAMFLKSKENNVSNFVLPQLREIVIMIFVSLFLVFKIPI